MHPAVVAQADGSVVRLVHTEEDVDGLYLGTGSKVVIDRHCVTVYAVHKNCMCIDNNNGTCCVSILGHHFLSLWICLVVCG